MFLILKCLRALFWQWAYRPLLVFVSFENKDQTTWPKNKHVRKPRLCYMSQPQRVLLLPFSPLSPSLTPNISFMWLLLGYLSPNKTRRAWPGHPHPTGARPPCEAAQVSSHMAGISPCSRMGRGSAKDVFTLDDVGAIKQRDTLQWVWTHSLLF